MATTTTNTPTESCNASNWQALELMKIMITEINDETEARRESGKAPNWAEAGDAAARLTALIDAASMTLGTEPEDIRRMLRDKFNARRA